MTAQLKDTWFDPAASTFGDRLAGAREQSGMSQSDLAKRLGVKLATLKSWEDDFNEPRANKLQMLAGILNVSLSWILTGEGEGIDAPDDVLDSPGDVQDLVLERAANALSAGADGVVASAQAAALIRALPEAAGKLIVTPGVRPAGAALFPRPNRHCSKIDSWLAQYNITSCTCYC